MNNYTMRGFLFFVIWMLSIGLFATDITSNTLTGNWNDPASWIGSAVPQIGDNVTIASGAVIVLNTDADINNLTVLGTLTIGNNGTARSLIIAGYLTVNATSVFTVGNTLATHSVTISGNVINNGVLQLYNGSGKVANLTLNGDILVSGSNSPIFSNININSGTVTAGVALNIEAGLTIEDGAVFNDGALTHTVAGNWSENGNGQLTGGGSITLDGAVVQVISTAATFNNLTLNGGGIVSLQGSVIVTGNFEINNNTTVTTALNPQFRQHFTVASGSVYKCTSGTTYFNGTVAQNITIGTTNGAPAALFYQTYVQNGGAANPKILIGNFVGQTWLRVYTTSVLQDDNSAREHTIVNFRMDPANSTTNLSGTLNIRGTVMADGGNLAFSMGTGVVNIMNASSISEGDTWQVYNDVNILYRYLVVSNTSVLEQQNPGKILRVEEGTNLYVRGSNNFPTGFDTYDIHKTSSVRYDANLLQTVRGDITYGNLLVHYQTATVDGPITVNGVLYLRNAVTFNTGTFDHTFKSHIDNNSNGSLNAPGGTISLNATDINQYIEPAGTGSYVFNNLTLSMLSLTAVRRIDIDNDITVNGNFTVSNPGGSSINQLQIDVDANEIINDGGDQFLLNDHVMLRTSGQDNFPNSINSFSAKSFTNESVVYFDGTAQNIPGGFFIQYGSIHCTGNGNKTVLDLLVVKTDLLRIGNNATIFVDNGRDVYIGGDWKGWNSNTNMTAKIYFNGAQEQFILGTTFNNVEFQSSGVKTLLGTLNVANDLKVSSGSTFTAGVQSINIGGDWEVLGTGLFTQTTGTTTFNGNLLQTITANTDSYFGNLTVNKQGALKMLFAQSDFKVALNFNFTEDYADFFLNGNTLYIGRDWIFRDGCTFTHSNGTLVFYGNNEDQRLLNINPTITYYNLVFEGNAFKNLEYETFDVDGDFTINNSIVNTGEIIQLAGNWQNTGSFSSNTKVEFNGTNQTVSATVFHDMELNGIGTKTLTGNISTTGWLRIGQDATLDVSTGNYSVTVEESWYNAEGSGNGKFLCRQGNVNFIGGNANLITGGSGAGKQFYNLVINKNKGSYMRMYHNPDLGAAMTLDVENSMQVLEGIFYTYAHEVTIAGDLVVTNGLFSHNAVAPYAVTFDATSGTHIFDPGSNGAGWNNVVFDCPNATYELGNDMKFDTNYDLTINNGTFDLNHHTAELIGGGGDLFLTGGTLQVDSAGVLKLDNGADFINTGGNLELLGTSITPATMSVSTSGSYTYTQTAGSIAAKYFQIENTSGNGIDIQGGSINATANFTNGSFTGGTGTCYLNLSGIDLGGDISMTNTTFNNGPTYNVQRISGNGSVTLENSSGTLAGENYDNDNADPGTLVDWLITDGKYWDAGGDATTWNDPLNWVGDALPDATSHVFLDNSVVAGDYTVVIQTADALTNKITINGSGNIALTLSGKELTVKDNLAIGGNGTLAQTNASDTIKVGGDWSNEGTYTPNGSVVLFNPSSRTATISSTLVPPDPFYDLVINSDNGTVAINYNLDVANDLKVIGGTFDGAAGYSISISGNWKVSGGTFNPRTTTVFFNNTGDQNIEGGYFYNLQTTGSGTKSITANISVYDLTIGAGTVLSGGSNFLYMRHNWTNNVGPSGFNASTGTVVFNGNNQIIGNGGAETTFNDVIVNGINYKYVSINTVITGNLSIIAGYLSVENGITINGSGANNSLITSNNTARIYIRGVNNFPTGFESINLAQGYVFYTADIDQTIYPTDYYHLYLQRQNAANLQTKTASGSFTVRGSLNISDTETLLDINEHTLTLTGGIVFPTGGRQIDWGSNGTVLHNGGNWTIDADITGFNNVIKSGTGNFYHRYTDLSITGNFTVQSGTRLYMYAAVKMHSAGGGSTFTVLGTGQVAVFTPDYTAVAFPYGFTNYDLSASSRTYLYGSENQTIYSTPIYGNLYLYSGSAITYTLDGNLDVNGDFDMYGQPILADAGFDMHLAGSTIDIRQYTPTTNTIYFDGQDQFIHDGEAGTQDLAFNNVVFMGQGIKNINNNGDFVRLTGNLQVQANAQVLTTREWHFGGSTWDNLGTFTQTQNRIYFNKITDQTINPGANHSFYGVTFNGGATKNITNHGLLVGNGVFEIQGNTTVNMGTLTHLLAPQTFDVEAGSTWQTTTANLTLNRNGVQTIPELTVNNLLLKSTNGAAYYRTLDGALNANNLTIEEIYLRASLDNTTATATHNITLTGSWQSNSRFYAYDNTVFFESNNTDSKTIEQIPNYGFHNLVLNSTQTAARTYLLSSDIRVNEDLTIGNGATLFSDGNAITLGNNDTDAPNAETHHIQTGGTLALNAGSALMFDCNDTGNPTLDVNGTLELIGENANLVSVQRISGGNRIQMSIKSGGTIKAKYYELFFLADSGLVIDNGATIDPTYNLSEGVFSDINTQNLGDYKRYLYLDADLTGLPDIENMNFRFNGTPVVGRHFNVKRNAAATGTLAFNGNMSGTLSGEIYEQDEHQNLNGSPGLITWPASAQVVWNGSVSTDWFTAGNWTPAIVPTNAIEAEIPMTTNNPEITGFDAICKKLNVTTGILQIVGGSDLTVIEDLTLGTNAILAVGDPLSNIYVGGSWDTCNNSIFLHGNATVYFTASSGSADIRPNAYPFNHITFTGAATFLVIGTNVYFDGDFTMNSGVVYPSTNNYNYYIKGNYNNVGGVFDISRVGEVYFAGADQTITNGSFYDVIIDGTATKTAHGSLAVKGAFTVNSNVQAAAGCVFDLNGNVTINPGALFADGGEIHLFAGLHWNGVGGYSGTGTVRFDGGNQYIDAGNFNSLHLVGGNVSKYLAGNVNLTGDLTIDSYYLRCYDYLIKNSSGTGTFSMNTNTRIYLQGADNFPQNFQTYNIDRLTYTYYEGSVDQTVAGVTYGYLYFYKNNTKTLSGNVAILGNMYIYNAAILDVSTNNYSITIAGHWYNNNEGSFICQAGEVVFNGNTDFPGVNQYIQKNSPNINNFYKLTVNAGTNTYVRLYVSNGVVKNNLRILSGHFYVYNNYTIEVGGDLTATNGAFSDAGHYLLNKSAGSAIIQTNGSAVQDLTINSGATYSVQDNLTVYGNLNISSLSTLDLNGQTATFGNDRDMVILNGSLIVGAGGQMKIGSNCTFSVQAGGTLYVVGTVASPARVSNGITTRRYYLNVESGGVIHAQYYEFQYMASTGVYIKSGATIDTENNFSNGTFTNSIGGGTCLKIENNQSFLGMGNRLENVNFPQNPGSGASNITKAVSTAGSIEVYNSTGEFSGENFDNDPYNLIDWTGALTLTWNGSVSSDWFNANNWTPSTGLPSVPTVNDKAVITDQLNHAVIGTQGAVAKSVYINTAAILELKLPAVGNAALTINSDIGVESGGTLKMNTANDSLVVRGNWDNKGAFLAGSGTVAFKAESGIVLLDNGSTPFNNLILNTSGTVQLEANLTISNDLIIENGTFDLSAFNRQVTVMGKLDNQGTINAHSGKFIFSPSSNKQINTGNATMYDVEINATSGATVQLVLASLTATRYLSINSGTLDLNGNNLYVGNGTSGAVNIGGTLDVGANEIIYMNNGASILVGSGGVFKLLGTNANNLASIRKNTNGNYGCTVGAGGTIIAEFYKLEHLNSNGLTIRAGAIVDASQNLSHGIFSSGEAGGRYILLENNYAAAETVTNITFNPGPAVNVKRISGTNTVSFEDAIGLLASYEYEQDEVLPAAYDTGLLRWSYSNTLYTWTGNTNSDWNEPLNWNIASGGNGVPTALAIVEIPDVSGTGKPFPILNATADGAAKSVKIFAAASLTIGSNYNLDVGGGVAILGTLTVENGSATTITCADLWSNLGVFNHGSASTVTLTAPTGSIQLITGGNSFYNLVLNSSGDAIFETLSEITVEGNFTNTAGTFKINDPLHTLTVGGNWVNNATYIHGNAAVVFNGDNQSISSSGAEQFTDISFSGSGTKNVSCDVLVTGSFTSSAIVNSGSAALEIKGDWNNTGIFTSSTGTVSFTGSTTQNISNGLTAASFNNLVMSNVSASTPQFILSGDIQISGQLSLTDGVIETSSQNMLFMLNGSTLAGGNSSASFVSGPMSRTGQTDFVFPTGDGTVFARMGISGMSLPSTFEAEYLEQQYSNITSLGAGLNNVSGFEYWALERTSGTQTPKVTYYWEDGARSEIDNLSDLVAVNFETGQWENKGGSILGTLTSGYVTSINSYTSFLVGGFGSISSDYNPLHSKTAWTGAVSADWNFAGNWSKGIPTSSISISIPNVTPNYFPVIGNAAVCDNITINPLAMLTINSGKSLVANGNLTVNGTLNIKSDVNDTGALLTGGNVDHTSGSVNVDLFLSANKFHYISSPFSATDGAKFSVAPWGAINPNYYDYDENYNDSDLELGWHSASGALTPGKGYAYLLTNNYTPNMAGGNLNNGNISIPVTNSGYGAAPNGWNLIGNPYPSPISALEFLSLNQLTNTVIDGTVFFWEDADADGTYETSDYAYWNGTGFVGTGGSGQAPNGYIGVGQAFMVHKSVAGTENVHFTNDMRTTQSAVFFKTEKALLDIEAVNLQKFKIKLTDNKKQYNETLVTFASDASLQHDPIYDAVKLTGNKDIALFTEAYGLEYAIQGQHTLYPGIHRTIALGVRISTAGEYTLALSDLYNIHESVAIVLQDKHTGILTNIRETESYTFQASPENVSGRFRLHLNYSEGDENIDENLVTIYANQNTVYVQFDTYENIEGQICIYDFNGRLLKTVNVGTKYSHQIPVWVPTGLYIVKVVSAKAEFNKTSKVLILRN